MTEQRDPDHHFCIEINVTSYVATPDGHALGDNASEVTFAFVAGIEQLPSDHSDAVVNRALVRGMLPVLAIIREALTRMGFAYAGEVAVGEEAFRHSNPAGEETAVNVLIRVPLSVPEGKA